MAQENGMDWDVQDSEYDPAGMGTWLELKHRF